ncbi:MULTISPECIES: hypothetical protein [Acidithiobacillus]|jgi:hypothetical protein|uniref:Uncharacterized protein n=2 Tax=Acidithiobacillus ferridurans TaxID=1232575 RepID=A0A8X8GGI7_ACIFI|nr:MULTISPECIES: hypothetical protein [Acidithiobacillus]MBU2714897.1 hypothetical protein [Acidithiobacillus ferridurans]MBU2719775.1 hypothetical protein [Acidithiobacillus ferridurans]MBU2723723.1 hypothetical protein [Acidithiobacillus ferridurans]MBU2727432.1 hypothetical protein [Acidithiobacillus ferridurans]MBU2803603.1 hypothetical protein [Acidithiobacillus ferridurans]
MLIKDEQEKTVTIHLSAREAGAISADIIENGAKAGNAALALANLLREQGYIPDTEGEPRYEWAGPDDLPTPG